MCLATGFAVFDVNYLSSYGSLYAPLVLRHAICFESVFLVLYSGRYLSLWSLRFFLCSDVFVQLFLFSWLSRYHLFCFPGQVGLSLGILCTILYHGF